jgi:hypothetical protein
MKAILVVSGLSLVVWLTGQATAGTSEDAVIPAVLSSPADVAGDGARALTGQEPEAVTLSMALAGPPIKLTDLQMDKVTAGVGNVPFQGTGNGLGPAIRREISELVLDMGVARQAHSGSRPGWSIRNVQRQG